ncbi:hypothetical protein T484DRAFT_1637252, partial [Baffinella frigidus]
RQVTVQAGARVSQVLEALRPHGLTLQNLASINEQQVGGFIQVSAHGSGAALPPVDEQVVGLTLVTPGQGTLRLHKDDEEDQELMGMCRVGLGALGVVADVTLQCVPYHTLVERTWVSTEAEEPSLLLRRLKPKRHLRYMWIPYTDTVVVEGGLEGRGLQDRADAPPPRFRARAPRNPRSLHLLSLLKDALLRLDPLSVQHVKAVNKAEAECWKRSEGPPPPPSEHVLGSPPPPPPPPPEVAFPAGEGGEADGRDIAYVKSLRALIEATQVPAPGPIEQRWTAASSSRMSPAHSERGDDLFSWVGIIMYLPEAEEDQHLRPKITKAFKAYKESCRMGLWPTFGAHEHWAKIEDPDGEVLEALQARLAERFPAEDFVALRKRLDPHNILANNLVNSLFPPAAAASK